MILVDTTVVVAYLRSADPRLPTLFTAHQAAICGVTRAEILHGVRNTEDDARFAAALNRFQQVSISDALWDEVGAHLAALRAAGLPTPFADVIIAPLAIHLDVELWSRDQHHVTMQAAVPALRLFQEPP
jgi:predicted nucleic acid-binding protein